jgi:hypothetical protein
LLQDYPFKCSICGINFLQRCFLTTHLDSHFAANKAERDAIRSDKGGRNLYSSIEVSYLEELGKAFKEGRKERQRCTVYRGQRNTYYKNNCFICKTPLIVDYMTSTEQWVFKDSQRIIVTEGDSQKEVIVHAICADSLKKAIMK